MSTVAPPRSRGVPSPISLYKPTNDIKGRDREIVLHKVIDAPTKKPVLTLSHPEIPPKSPDRPAFAPTPLLIENGKAPDMTLPPAPTPPISAAASPPKLNNIDKTPNSFFPKLAPSPPIRSDTRLSNASTAINSQDSGSSASLRSPATPIQPPSPARLPRNGTLNYQPSHSRNRSPSRQSHTHSTRDKLVEQANTLPPSGTGKSSTGQRVRDGAFFAFVLLPLSCWYTRGGKRIKEIDARELENEKIRAHHVDDREWRGRAINGRASMERMNSMSSYDRPMSRDDRSGPPPRYTYGRSMSFDRSMPPSRADVYASVGHDRSRPPTSSGGRDGPRARVSMDDVRRARAGTMDGPPSRTDSWTATPRMNANETRRPRAGTLDRATTRDGPVLAPNSEQVKRARAETLDRPLLKSSMADPRRPRAESFGAQARRDSGFVRWEQDLTWRFGLPLKRRNSTAVAEPTVAV